MLENGTGADTTFAGDEDPRVWSTPSVDDPPVTFQVEPVGTFPAGALFAYDLTVDVSALPAGETGLAFRPCSFTDGTMSPSQAALVRVATLPAPSGVRGDDRHALDGSAADHRAPFRIP